jgi:hypothetical protein
MRMSVSDDRVAPRGGAALGKVQRKCACEDEGHPCDECKEKKELEKGAQLARHATPGDRNDDEHHDASAGPLVRETLAAPGVPLDAEARGFLEPRFGHDFGRGARTHGFARGRIGERSWRVGVHCRAEYRFRTGSIFARNGGWSAFARARAHARGAAERGDTASVDHTGHADDRTQHNARRDRATGRDRRAAWREHDTKT